MARIRTAVVGAAVVVALGLSGCNGGGESSPGVTTTSVRSSSKPTSNDPYCRSLQGFNERYGRINLGLAEPERFRVAMTDAAAAGRDAEAAAPPAIKPDLAVVNANLQKLLGLLERVNFDITRLQLAELEQLQTPELLAASQRLETYARDNCG